MWRLAYKNHLQEYKKSGMNVADVTSVEIFTTVTWICLSYSTAFRYITMNQTQFENFVIITLQNQIEIQNLIFSKAK